ncbi:DNA oxidative demethylase AlkB [Roseomonas sp. USHLN139]|uniref:DNA oxidative demethylase AlkB n=1 Tax=Roseomonas sp. USHLN139 TaxID=3081298 RepID=UPI003B01BDB4
MAQPDLFAPPPPARESLSPGALLLRGFALEAAPDLLAGIAAIAAAAPFRHMVTPGGFTMSVAMTSCGALGWVTDRRGYRYTPRDPDSGAAWPAMPEAFRALAERAAAEAGFPGFAPDTCLINRYLPGAKLALHQDKDERDTGAPIVSVSLGLPATFQWGGLQRGDPVRRLGLDHGDVLAWGGPSRLFHHGILALKPGRHPATGAARLNLTFRRAG